MNNGVLLDLETVPALNEPTYARIKRTIVADLVAHTFKPGDQLTIEMLTSRYGVSHMPIREALRKLEGEGIIVSTAHKGFRFREIDARYIRNIYDIRIAIEAMLAHHAARLATPDDVAALSQLHEQFVRLMDGTEPRATQRANRAFHARLYRIADNPEAEAILEGRAQIVRTFNDSLGGYRQPEVRARVIREHTELLEAVAAGDAERCFRVMLDHVTGAQERLLRMLAESQVLSSTPPVMPPLKQQ